MPKLRQDLATRKWSIIALERAKRPDDFLSGRKPHEPEPSYSATCPFCKGNEHMAPEPVYIVYNPAKSDKTAKRDKAGWAVRVVPNKYPALVPGEAIVALADGPFETIVGAGIHEVVVESASHDLDTADFPIDHLRDLLRI